MTEKTKKVLPFIVLLILGCSLPIQLVSETSTPSLPPQPAALPTFAPTPTFEPGTEKNPLILALTPSARPSGDAVAAAETIAAFLESRSGYKVVTTAPASEAALIEALEKGNAHIAPLTPFGYLLGRRSDSVTAILASLRNGEAFYGAQFIANRKSGFTSYFDSARGENTANAAQALSQLKGKKPCWSEAASPSAHVIPLGVLKQARIETAAPAFLAGQVNVVRAVYADDICDFGATFIDARDLPSLEADYPDVMERVIVLWRLPKVIPYENLSLASSLPLEMRRVLQRAFLDLMLTSEGKAAVQTAYGMDEIQVAEDAMYDDFAAYAEASGINLAELLK
jgi:phosphonate transport system substrate-binding protein